MKNSEKEAIKSDEFQKNIEAFYKKLELALRNTNVPLDFSFFDKVDVTYSSCAGI